MATFVCKTKTNFIINGGKTLLKSGASRIDLDSSPPSAGVLFWNYRALLYGLKPHYGSIMSSLFIIGGTMATFIVGFFIGLYNEKGKNKGTFHCLFSSSKKTSAEAEESH